MRDMVNYFAGDLVKCFTQGNKTTVLYKPSMVPGAVRLLTAEVSAGMWYLRTDVLKEFTLSYPVLE